MSENTFRYITNSSAAAHLAPPDPTVRLRILTATIALVAAVIVTRLAIVQIFEFHIYRDLANGAHELYRALLPERGKIYFADEAPAALNEDVYLLYADNQLIDDPEKTAEMLAAIFGLDAKEKFVLFLKFQDQHKRYVPIAERLKEETAERIRAAKLPSGIALARQSIRFYPEKNTGSHVLGFYGKDRESKYIGRYGIEGHFDEALAGKHGYVRTERDPLGGWIPLAARSLEHAADGADIVLTIDRAVQYKLCDALRRGLTEYSAVGATGVVMHPKTGAIIAMCTVPDFDPHEYNKVTDIALYNNDAIFRPYEPGSVFKPFGMAAAIDQGAVTPDTKYTDEGMRKFANFIIKNAANKKYGEQTMTQVLQQSINTGMIFAVFDKLGKEKFRDYVHAFGFGEKTGIELDTEAPADVSSLDKPGDIYTATASFGQGITATPLQLTAAFAALANGGELMRPYIVSEISAADGRVEKREPQLVRRVLAPRTAALISGMLVTVVTEGHGKRAQITGYTVAGKTGTAQIPGPGGYTDATNQTFIGFAPVEDPAFVMLVKFENPERQFAEYTAVPTWSEVAKFMLEYYNVPPR